MSTSTEAIGQTTTPYFPPVIIEDYRGPNRCMLDSFEYEIVRRSPGTTLENAKVVIILERHNDPFYAKFYGLVLDRFYNKQPGKRSKNDILFIEAPPNTDLWLRVFEVVKIVSKLRDSDYVSGWGNLAFHELKGLSFRRDREPVIDHALNAAYELDSCLSSEEEKIDAEKIVKDACPLLRDLDDRRVLSIKAHDLLVEELTLTYAEAFITNQKELIKKMNNYYNERKTLFFICGKHHGDLRSVKKARRQKPPEVIESVENLYQNLEGKEFIIIYPKQPKMTSAEISRYHGTTQEPQVKTTLQAIVSYMSSFFQ